MKNIINYFLALVILLGIGSFSSEAQAQLRKNLPSPYDYTGPIINRTTPTVQHSLNQFFQKIFYLNFFAGHKSSRFSI